MLARFALLFIEDSIRIPVRRQKERERENTEDRIKRQKKHKASKRINLSLGVVGSMKGSFPMGRQHIGPFKHCPAWTSVSRQNSWQEPFGRSQISLNLPLAVQKGGLL